MALVVYFRLRCVLLDPGHPAAVCLSPDLARSLRFNPELPALFPVHVTALPHDRDDADSARRDCTVFGYF